jgi:hypothetical protein
MLLTVAYDERTAFDGLLAYAKLMRVPPPAGPWGPAGSNTGLMNWLRYGCDAHRDTIYNEYPDGGGRRRRSRRRDVAHHGRVPLGRPELRRGGDHGHQRHPTAHVLEDGGLRILQPGDGSWFDDQEIGMPTGCVNYSYFAPPITGRSRRRSPRTRRSGTARPRMPTRCSPAPRTRATGLVRNWGSASGGDAVADCQAAYTRASSYGDDAARTPWRIGTDYLWNGTPKRRRGWIG